MPSYNFQKGDIVIWIGSPELYRPNSLLIVTSVQPLGGYRYRVIKGGEDSDTPVYKYEIAPVCRLAAVVSISLREKDDVTNEF